MLEPIAFFVQLQIVGIGLDRFDDIIGIALIGRRAVNLKCQLEGRPLGPCKFHQQSVHDARDLKPGTLRFDGDIGKKPFWLGLCWGWLLVVLFLFISGFVRRDWLLRSIVNVNSGWPDSLTPYK